MIVVSDHGMTSINGKQMINITETLDMEDIVKVTEGGTQTYIWPVKGKEQKVGELWSSLIVL